MMTKDLELKVIAGKGAGRVIVIPLTGAIIGRQPPAEVLVDEPAVSRRHCSIYPRRNDWLVEDLASQNGTLLNGVPISKEVLHPGDRIQVGETVLRVPRSLLKPVIVVAATAAGLLIVTLVWHWAAARPSRSATEPESASPEKSASATPGAAGSSSPDSDLTDSDIAHPHMKQPSR
jgi:pSer/pThr/pTyr-binding forkhead associated (FHA) protein